MSTLEKLFMQIFERKDSIVEQMQQQADYYTQQFASELLIDGITPPPWLLSPNFNSSSSDPNGMEKEKIISKLLLGPPRDLTRFSTGGPSMYYRPVAAAGNGHLSDETCMNNLDPIKAFSVSNEPVSALGGNGIGCLNCVPELDDNVISPLNEMGARISIVCDAPDMTHECHNNDIGCSSNLSAEHGDSVKSPQNEKIANITSIYAAPDMSLARIQRSKSRQKARELRTNGKTNGKSCLSNDNRTHISFSGNLNSKKDIFHVTRDKCPSEVEKCNDISGSVSMTAEEKGNKANIRTIHSSTLAKSSSSYEKPSLENDLIKRGVCSGEENVDGGIMVQPTENSLQQYGHGNGVTEGVNLPDLSLGSFGSRKLRTGKGRGTQSQTKPFCGRITRSRSSSQQTSGINKFSNVGTSVSCNPKEGEGAFSHSVDDLVHEVNASNTLLDAVETSQVLCDRIKDAQAICNSRGVLKSVSSNMDVKESSLGGSQQEKAEIVMRNRQIDSPSVMQPVNSGIKLDPVTDGCCMKVKPKQLNFDEISECGFSEVCSPLSKKRKLDGLLGHECYPSKESTPSIDHKSSSNFFEQQSPKENVSSINPEAASTEYHNTDECAEDETMNIVLEMNENPMAEDVDNNCKVSLNGNITREVNISSKEADSISNEEMHPGMCHLNEDNTCSLKMQIEEAELDHKGEESGGRVFIPVSQKSKSAFVSSLMKQRNKDFEVDLGSKSKDLEVGTNLTPSNMNLSSAKFNTCPLNQQKYVEDQPNCFSDSRKFGVHIQRDAIHLNLKTPENDLNSTKDSASILLSEKINLSQSDAIQSCDTSFHNEMTCDFPEGAEALHKLQALQVAEETVTEVNDDITVTTDTPKQSEPTSVLNAKKNAAYMGPVNPISIEDVMVTDNNNFEMNLSEWVSSYDLVQPSQDDKLMAFSDQITHVNEDFIIDEEIGNLNIENNESRIDFDTLEIPSTTIARASIIEQICKSASMQTPLSQFPSTYTQHQIQDLYACVADENHGILDHMVGTTESLDEGSIKHLQTSGSCMTETDSVFLQHQKFSYGTPFSWQSKNHYLSPTGKLWERSASSSSSSGKQLSSHPDLTCFPIEEDPSSNEENENAEDMSDDLQENIISKLETENSARVYLQMKTERTENDYEATIEIQEEPPLKSSELWSHQANLVSATSMKYQDRHSSNSVNIEASVPRTRDKVKHKPKVHHGFKVSTYEGSNRNSSMITRASSRGDLSEISKNKSSMRSGIPRVSQKEGKRNNIVSNITSFIPIVQQKQAAAVCTGKRDIKVKALEAAEAAKRREQDKENERRIKKEALKLERERIGKENAKEMELNLIKKREALKRKEADIAAKKRLREEEERKQLAKKRKVVAEAHKNQKLKSEKLRTGKVEMEKHATNVGNKKKSENLRQNKSAYENSVQKQDTKLRTEKTLANIVQQVSSNDFGEKEKATSMYEKSPVKVGQAKLTGQESSYDISPYQCSDDEDDEEDDLPTKKFIPTWASRNHLAMVQPLQQKLDPESIFSLDTFCSINEVVLPRRLQGQ